MELILVRHALPERVENVSGVADPGLQELGWAQARRLADYWLGIFGDRFYLEVQRTGRPQEESLIAATVELALTLDAPVVATLPDADLLARVREECLAGAYYLLDWRGYAGYEPGDNVVQLFAMGSVATEAVEAAHKLLARGVFQPARLITQVQLREFDFRRRGGGFREGVHWTGRHYRRSFPAWACGVVSKLAAAGLPSPPG